MLSPPHVSVSLPSSLTTHFSRKCTWVPRSSQDQENLEFENLLFHHKKKGEPTESEWCAYGAVMLWPWFLRPSERCPMAFPKGAREHWSHPLTGTCLGQSGTIPEPTCLPQQDCCKDGIDECVQNCTTAPKGMVNWDDIFFFLIFRKVFIPTSALLLWRLTELCNQW